MSSNFSNNSSTPVATLLLLSGLCHVLRSSLQQRPGNSFVLVVFVECCETSSSISSSSQINLVVLPQRTRRRGKGGRGPPGAGSVTLTATDELNQPVSVPGALNPRSNVQSLGESGALFCKNWVSRVDKGGDGGIFATLRLVRRRVQAIFQPPQRGWSIFQNNVFVQRAPRIVSASRSERPNKENKDTLSSPKKSDRRETDFRVQESKRLQAALGHSTGSSPCRHGRLFRTVVTLGAAFCPRCRQWLSAVSSCLSQVVVRGDAGVSPWLNIVLPIPVDEPARSWQ
ncbi:hypothetical protein IWX49DRAFT_346156 [Phyllosticta citricarpa]